MFNSSVGMFKGAECPVIDLGKQNQISIAKAQDKLINQRIELHDDLQAESRDDLKNFIKVKIREEFKDLMKESILELIGETGIREVALQKEAVKKAEQRKKEMEKFVENMKKQAEEEQINPTFYTKETAQMLGVTTSTLCKWAKNKQIKGEFLGVGFGWAFKKNDILAFKQSKKLPPVLREIDLADIHPVLSKWYNLHRKFKKNAYLIQHLAAHLDVTQEIVNKWLTGKVNIPQDKIKALKSYLDNTPIADTTTKMKMNFGKEKDPYLTVVLLRKMGLAPMSYTTIIKYAKAGLIDYKKIKMGNRLVFYIRANHMKNLLANPPEWLNKSLKWSYACRSNN